MSKQIWLSPVLGNSRERLVERCAEMIRSGESHRFLYLTASHPLLELVTKWILDFDTIRGVMGTLPVFLFRGFVRHVLATAIVVDSGLALAKRTPIDAEDSNLKKSLLSQIMRQLVARGELKALAPLANRDGTVNTIATLIGEIQRAAKRPDEFRAIIESRADDLFVTKSEEGETIESSAAEFPQQLDFDREIGTIFEEYSRALDRFQLTEADADQLRALQVITGEVDSRQVTLPWLDQVELLILDGFFDFTPVQGEILRRLIPSVPHVIVNLYGDEENVEVFSPFAETVEQLSAMSGDFEVVQHRDTRRVGDMARVIRRRLFNSAVEGKHIDGTDGVENNESDGAEEAAVADVGGRDARAPRVFRCSDRETEVREIAKEIKRLVLDEKFSIREVALVVRQRASYAETIARLFAEEKIPCTIELSQNLTEVPAIRAVLKLFQILKDKRDAENPRVTDLADLIKSGYFRLTDESIRALLNNSISHQTDLPGLESDNINDPSQRLKNTPASISDQELTSWNPDEIENVIAYVGSELRLDRWLERARQLASTEAFAGNVRSELFDDDTTETDDIDESFESEDTTDNSKPSGQTTAPPREVPPAVLNWASVLVEAFATTFQMMPREADGANLRLALLKLLDELHFAQTIRHSMVDLDLDDALPHAAIELRALSGLRQAMAAAIKSIEISKEIIVDEENRSTTITVVDLITEIERCIGAQTLVIAGADRDGLQVLEATDVRGLQFRAIFIAGLIEGGFPLRKPRDWIYPHEERERLKKYGLTLEDISPATLLKEEHYFYQTASRATERLYLTWPLVLEGDEETVVSYYIDEVAHALAPLEIKSEDKRRDFDGDGVLDSSSHAELAASLVRLDERHRHRGQERVHFKRDVLDNLLAWAEDQKVLTSSARKRIAIGRERIGERFGRYDGLITNEDLRNLLAKRFGADYVWSASALSLYGKSPFKFFAERVLKLERRIEAALDLAAMDAGGLLHEALRSFLQNHRGVRLKNSDRSKLREEMRTIADKVFGERERAVPPLNLHVWRIDRETQQLQLAQVVDYEIDLQASSEEEGVLPNYFELGFGMEHGVRDESSTPEFLTLTRDDAYAATDAIRLRGQIDRVDVASDGTLIAYDYKKSQGAKEDDMLEGRDLQIGIYLDALEKIFFPRQVIAGGGYYLLRTPNRNQGLYRAGFDGLTQISSKVSSRYDDEQWLGHRATMRRRIWQFVDNIRAGRFVVKPTAPDRTCKTCEFLTVCRYEKYRIMRKNDAN